MHLRVRLSAFKMEKGAMAFSLIPREAKFFDLFDPTSDSPRSIAENTSLSLRNQIPELRPSPRSSGCCSNPWRLH